MLHVNILKIHNKSEFKHMLYVFHNAVNKRKRKVTPNFLSVIDRYKYMTIPNTYNNFISVYQTEGMGIHDVYQTIRKKVESKQFDSRPWIGGMSTGAWKIQVGKSDD